ncbi:MAG: methylmalonyl Co-A mutase-associated GTPase MeaB [Alphaproteobacteria bacterium]|nr:methylmalonyl Co-A mutase-associated GTPase MeaB [Alphaproteobacteria bacterium]
MAEIDIDLQAPFVTNNMNTPSLDIAKVRDLATSLVNGDRRSLAKSITLVESRRPKDAAAASLLINAALPHAGRTVRIGLSGAPGVGKSSFIEAFGTWLISQGKRVAVLAVDPSSRRTGGSILGDKTRMVKLAQSHSAFIRPSPAGTTLGGVARRTRESIILVEAAGFDVVLVETVGVGQSETAVADMVDMFIVLVSPSGGDELQGIKRGIMELADLVIVTKADGDLMPAATRTAAEYTVALHLMKPKFENWPPAVALVSSTLGTGVSEVWAEVQKFERHLNALQEWDNQRRRQKISWLWNELREGLLGLLTENAEIKAEMTRLEKKVAGGSMAPTVAATAILSRVLGKS